MDGRLSRRDFLRLKKTDRGKLLEVSCHTLFMRCADASIDHAAPAEWESWMGEPPAVLHRRSADEILEAFEDELQDVQILRLLEPEWMNTITGGSRLQAAIAAFRARGGVVESADVRT